MDISPEWKERVKNLFPEFQEGINMEFSEVDYNYNCLSWALSCNTRYFEKSKGSYWPWDHIPDDTADGWADVCRFHGFESIPVENTAFVPGIEKVAILIDKDGELHATRQNSVGWWKSKLGSWGPDIDHATIDGIKSTYGEVVHLLQKLRPDWL